MISPLAYDMAKAHIDDLHRTAARASAPRRPQVRVSMAPQSRTRQRAGWWLVTVGLRIAGPVDAR